MVARVATAIVAGMVWMAAAAGAAERSPGGGLSAALAEAGFAGRETCRRALETLPTERMMAEERQVVEHFHRGTTLHRKLPAETIRCQQSLLEFVLVKPETLVDVWRVLGISRVSLDPVGPGRWRLSDGYGTTGTVRLLHHERGPAGGLLVFHGRGGYTGPLAPKPLTGGCLLVVRHEPPPGGDGSAQRVEVEAFLEVDGLGLEIVTRTLQPLIVRSAAANVHEICLFMGQFSAAASRNPSGMARLAEQLPRTGPVDRRMLVALASGESGTPAEQSSAGSTDVSEELAARWLTADDLDTIRR